MPLPAIISKRRKPLLFALVMNGAGQAALTLATSYLVHLVFATLKADVRPDLVWTLATLGGGLTGSAGLLAWLRTKEGVTAELLGQDYVNEVRVLVFSTLSSTPVRNLQKRRRGSIMLRFVGDMKSLKQMVSNGLARSIVASLTITTTLLALSFVQWELAITALVIIIPGLLVTAAGSGRLDRAVRKARHRQAHLASNVHEKLSSAAIVQVSGQARRERHRVAKQGGRLMEALVDQARVSASLQSSADFTAALASASVLLVGAYLAWEGRTTASIVVAAMMIVHLLTPALRTLGKVYTTSRSGRVSHERLTALLASQTDKYSTAGGENVLREVKGRVEFDHICQDGSLTHFSAIAEAGKSVAIVGPNGAGKSTLLSVAARLGNPTGGRVLLDGIDLARFEPQQLRRHLGMVSPDLPLLRGTIEKNLRYRWPDAPQEEVDRIMTMCRLNDILRDLPDGSATRVSEGGSNLSPGHRQRIALARALLGSPAVLLLDDADASLDPISRSILEEVLARFSGTTLFVTHRYEFAERADCIWYLAGGRLLESGTPQELLGGKSRTAQFFFPSAGISILAG